MPDTQEPDFTSLRHQLLIAMPQLGDPRFAHSVTYLFEHNADGAMGVIVNKPLDLDLGELLQSLDIEPTVSLDSHQLMYGGPVQAQRGFVLHRSDPALPAWNHSVTFASGLTLATSRDILEAIARGEGPARTMVLLGYAGWGAGQLEQEIADNSWLVAPPDIDLLFDTPAEARWLAAAKRIGVDLALISPEAGHA